MFEINVEVVHPPRCLQAILPLIQQILSLQEYEDVGCLSSLAYSTALWPVHPPLCIHAISGTPRARVPTRPCCHLMQPRRGAGKRVVHLIVSRTATGSSVRFVAAFASSYLNSPWGQRQVCCTRSLAGAHLPEDIIEKGSGHEVPDSTAPAPLVLQGCVRAWASLPCQAGPVSSLMCLDTGWLPSSQSSRAARAGHSLATRKAQLRAKHCQKRY